VAAHALRGISSAVQASPPGRIPSLDGLRALSIVLVMFSHLLGTAGFPLGERALGAAGDLGYLGVRVFFVISGYLITLLLIAEQAKRGRISLREFYIRRAYRILPAAYALILAISLAALLGDLSLKPADVVTGVTYTTNYHYTRSWELGHLWSLSVEEQFYLLWPALVVLFGARRIVPLSVALLVLAPVFRMIAWFHAPSPDDVVMEAYPCIMDAIAAGCLLAGARSWLDGQRWYGWLTGGWGFVLVLGAIAATQIPSDRILFDYIVAPSVMNVALALVVDRCVRFPGDVFGKFLNWRPIVFAGTLSYSLYLWQQPFLNHNAHAGVTVWPVNLFLAIGCALGSYYLVERPFMAIRERRMQRRRAKA
jgi:peptidoglycan/LPS O-acetylase OafA/YrhL